MPSPHILTGFGFGPIQSGLFACEAFRSGNFSRLVIAEVDQSLVDAVRAAGGAYCVNIAKHDGIETVRVSGVEMLNPNLPGDRAALVNALRHSTEIVTALPSVAFFDRGDDSPAALLAAAFADHAAPATLVYTAENNNHAAEIFEEAVATRLGRPAGPRVQFLNTVIGKMSRVVTDPAEIEQKQLAPLAPGLGRAHLVEAFNKILVTRCAISDVQPGIPSFIEKSDLFPFEEAKLYGHNAIHALMGFLGARKGYRSMAELARDAEIMRTARDAFLNESGAALIKKYSRLHDELFTPEGFRRYAEDLLERITNPYLDDSIERATRDPLRKLAPGDRIFGTMALCIAQGIKPENMALGAAAGLRLLLDHDDSNGVPKELRRQHHTPLNLEYAERLLDWVWQGQAVDMRQQMAGLIAPALHKHFVNAPMTSH